MAWHRLSWLIKVPVVMAAGLALFGLAGCGGDEDAPCDGILRDGKCYAYCDETIDCKGNPKLKCVAYTGQPPEGKCYGTCATAADCQAGETCAPSQKTLKGETVSICVARAIASLPPGNLNDACAKPDDCDGSRGLTCDGGKCLPPVGAACSSETCGAGRSCFQGKCAAAVAGADEDCGGSRTCDAAQGLVCFQGKCAAAIAGPDEACGGDRTCDPDQGLVCFESTCVPAVAGPGEGCNDERFCDEEQGLVCFQGKCGGAIAGVGEACADERPCDEAKALVCQDGVCIATTAGPGEACDAETPCNSDELVCFEGACRYGCKSFQGCAQGYECRGLAEGTSTAFLGACIKSSFPSAEGQYGTSCPKPEVCDKAGGFRCVGAKGDAKAFCAQENGCEKDADCPSGYWCGAVTNVKDSKGNIDFDNPIRVCMQRTFCSPCETNLDCSFVTNAICVPDADGEKFCSLPCNPSKNSCAIGAGCVDTGEGVFACRPDTGYCHAKGTPTGCDPCRIDSDCGPNSVCDDGAIGNKGGVRWCRTPCGAPDADGKRPCPVSPSGAEMLCLDENQLLLGGPFLENDPDLPNTVYGYCFRPLTVDNTTSGTKDPANKACGNGRREGTEECDDGNTSTKDGCAQCKITDTCRYTLTSEADGYVLKQGNEVFKEIGPGCNSFLVEGTLKNAGDAASFRFELPEGAYSWFEVFTGKAGTCSADLLATVRTGDYDAATDTVDIFNKDGELTACEGLSSALKNIDAPNPTLCPGNFIGCGSCTEKGICGSCDDDGGIGNCPRMLLSTTLSVQGYKVKFASAKQVAHISARDPKAAGVSFVAIGDRLTPGSQGPKNTPTLSCF